MIIVLKLVNLLRRHTFHDESLLSNSTYVRAVLPVQMCLRVEQLVLPPTFCQNIWLQVVS